MLITRLLCMQWKFTTGSPSLKYEHRRASALLRNIQDLYGKKPIVSVTYENERITIKNSLPYLKCVLRLSCAAHRPIYGRFMGFYVNGFLSNPLYGEKAVPLYWRSSILQGIYFLIRLGPWRPCRKDTRNKAFIFSLALLKQPRLLNECRK